MDSETCTRSTHTQERARSTCKDQDAAGRHSYHMHVRDALSPKQSCVTFGICAGLKDDNAGSHAVGMSAPGLPAFACGLHVCACGCKQTCLRMQGICNRRSRRSPTRFGDSLPMDAPSAAGGASKEDPDFVFRTVLPAGASSKRSTSHGGLTCCGPGFHIRIWIGCCFCCSPDDMRTKTDGRKSQDARPLLWGCRCRYASIISSLPRRAPAAGVGRRDHRCRGGARSEPPPVVRAPDRMSGRKSRGFVAGTDTKAPAGVTRPATRSTGTSAERAGWRAISTPSRTPSSAQTRDQPLHRPVQKEICF